MSHPNHRTLHTVSLNALSHGNLVNLSSVERLLNAHAANVKGKKRTAGSEEPRSRKRARVDTGNADNAAITERDDAAPVAVKTCLYRHSFHIDLISSAARPDNDGEDGEQDAEDEIDAHRAEQIEVEGRIKSWLAKHRGDDIPSTLDLGEVHLDVRKPSQRVRGVVPVPVMQVHSVHPEYLYVLDLPPAAEDSDNTDYDLRSGHLSQLLFSFEALCRDGRAEISAHLYVDVHDATVPELEEHVLPFTLRLDVEAAVVYAKMLEPFPPPVKGRPTEVEEAQRRVLMQYFPYTTSPASFQGTVDIPLLYTILGPAPRLKASEQEEHLQPEELRPTLLPFQCRSVAWLLSREGKQIGAPGHVEDIPLSQDSPLFWDEIRVGEETLYINRVLGLLSRVKPKNDADSLGGILAEEPGLGKTLECIALVLLNPSIGRTPANKRWDSVAKVDVREIKTTLIVTPSSLAQQWADELALHAPSLKVLVYDGWSKIPVPITESAAEKQRQSQSSRSSSKSKTVARDKSRASSKASSSGGSRRKRAQTVDTDMDVDRDATEDGQGGGQGEDVLDWCSYVNTFDVCITTYTVLQRDLCVARAPPTRPRRANVNYSENERARSPLIMCEWYRVIMDEVQMVGGGQAEEMVSLIPRLSSFAVSGTPARAQVADLIHVMRFLRVRPVTENPRIWPRLLKAPYANDFADLFSKYSIRTTKAAVKHELTIPKQTRYLVPIELGRVERHVYDQTFDRALLELGLDARGVAAKADWEIDTAVLRTWLRKLRGICTHPQVGQLLNAGDRLHKPGVLKSMEEVLEGMKEQNWRNLMEDRRNKIQLMLTTAQLRQHQEANKFRYRSALEILLAAEKEACRLIDDISAALADHAEKGVALKAGAAKRRAELSQASSSGEKGKGRASTELSDDDVDADEQGLPRNRAGEEHTSKTSALQLRLREARISLHKVHFLKGDVYHVLGEAYAGAENEAYAKADEMRRLLLKGTGDTAARAMTHVMDATSNKSLKESELHIEVPYCEPGGIRSADLIEEVHEIIDELLNRQSALLWQWRTKLVALLTQPLTPQDDSVDGQEYARSLETQGEAETYLQAYAALLADRRESLTAERTLLAIHDVRETHVRHTKAAQRALEPEDIVELDQLDDQEQLPEHEVLLKTLSEERKAILEDFDSDRAVRSVLVDLNNVVARISKDNDPEKILARDAATKLRALLADQNKLMDKLQVDLARLRRAFNERISYFRQLQEISDTVAEAEWEDSVDVAMANVAREQAELEKKIDTGRARQRYLDHLAQSHTETVVDEEERCCVLCRCDFLRGYITQCAHVFCETCLKEWISRREGKACPVCRVPIDSGQLQRFTIRDPKTETAPNAPQLIRANEVIPKSRRQIDYNYIDSGLFEDIQTMESLGSYGSKIDTLLRHLLYLKVADPGSKSIVFSAWADSLHIIQHALKRNGISCLRIDQQRGKEHAAKKFRTDPDIAVLLLHGERENAGLNVTCASRVFLVESVVHHAFELQAIARIDRMGQTKPTEVFCYFAEDTVERHILDLAARQGQSLYTKDNAAGTLDTSTFTLASGKNVIDSPTRKKNVQKGDFVFKTDDMLAIFFPHLYEDIEYLIQPADTTARVIASTDTATQQQPQASSSNTIAGPSTLPS
ncbi:SNF2 family N-terminal domain-containing protein [Rhodofomes roseus]|uniref:SNF2 family N-terminal domain-containing protein n=1 Tax=Rhodofomes roseus TaxID=34475 RepID=A0ABQ8KJ98_9APHY|nr:SNF2 family N-terminal domain-containing protein [Rhodofomes roseus]KAH9837867.1 SNF2 family N-terminal domain-containing protein [Rhodofomes roseus]